MKPLHPIYYALGGIVTVPLIAIIMVLLAAVLLVCWPILPFVMYLQRKEELANPPVDSKNAVTTPN